MRRGMTLAMTIATLAAGPALAAEDRSVSMADPCGDNTPHVTYNDTRQDLPATPRTPRFDLSRVTVDAQPGQVVVRFATCAPVGDPDGTYGFRSAYATLPDGCQLTLGAEERLPLQPRIGRAVKTCFPPPERSALPVGGPEPETKFDLDLPADAVSVEAGVLVLRVPRTGLPVQARATFASGTVWREFRAFAAESPTTYGFSFDTEGNTSSNNAPFGLDYAAGAPDLTL